MLERLIKTLISKDSQKHVGALRLPSSDLSCLIRVPFLIQWENRDFLSCWDFDSWPNRLSAAVIFLQYQLLFCNKPFLCFLSCLSALSCGIAIHTLVTGQDPATVLLLTGCNPSVQHLWMLRTQVKITELWYWLNRVYLDSMHNTFLFMKCNLKKIIWTSESFRGIWWGSKSLVTQCVDSQTWSHNLSLHVIFLVINTHRGGVRG